MGPEELLTEEEALKKLEINKAQLENYVREGKLSPLYQESVRKFKMSEISKLMGKASFEPVSPPEAASIPEATSTPETTSPPKVEPPSKTPPLPKAEPPPLKRPTNEGSHRIIEPPKEGRVVGVKATGEKKTEQFLKPLEKAEATIEGKWVPILLGVALVFSVFSVFVLAYNLKGKELPQINKIFSTLGSITIGKEESDKIESEANSIIQSAQKTKKDAEALIKETEELIKE